MPSLTPLVTTTELAAVNRLLAAIGEAPISDLVASTREDVILAATLIKEASIEVQSLGWRFNTEFGYELSPATTTPWTGADGSTATLNVFLPPANLLNYRLTASAAQSCLDLIIRQSRKYESPPGTKVLVFYDRKLNRDGLKNTDYTKLYIDPTWFFDWAFLPEAARRHITMRAGRQFVAKMLPGQEIVGFQERDELQTLYALQLQEGEEEDVSILDSTEVARVGGLRTGYLPYFTDTRSSTGTV